MSPILSAEEQPVILVFTLYLICGDHFVIISLLYHRLTKTYAFTIHQPSPMSPDPINILIESLTCTV